MPAELNSGIIIEPLVSLDVDFNIKLPPGSELPHKT